MAHSPDKRRTARVRIEALEPRVLYSADPLTTPLLDLLLHQPDSQISGDSGEPTLFSDEQLNAPTELVIVDTADEQLRDLYLQLTRQYENTTTKVVALQQSNDGMAQLSLVLSQYENLDAIHLVTHGSDGQMSLGGQSIDVNDINANQAAVIEWGNALSDNGDLLLYGCNLSATLAGQELASNLSVLMQADVASSDDITGHQDVGGDWDLEIVFGDVDTEQATTIGMQDDWVASLNITTSLLAHYELSNNSNDSVGTAHAVTSPSVPAYVAGKVGTAINFDQTDPLNPQYLVVDSTEAPDFSSGDASIAFWFRTSAIQSQMIIDHSDVTSGYTIRMLSSGTIEFQYISPLGASYSVTSIDVAQPNTWMHIAATFSNGTIGITSDGNSQSSNYPGTTLNDALTDLHIGQNSTGFSLFSGDMDDIRFYGKLLTATDINDLIALGGPAPNTEEVLLNNTGLTLSNGETYVLTPTELSATDAEQTSSQLTYTLVATVPGLSYLLGGTVLVSGDTFTQDDINQGRVSVFHDGNAAASGNMSLSLDDGLGTATNVDFNVSASANLAPTDIVLVSNEADIGIEMNLGAGDAAYWQMSDADAVFGGLQSFTFETSFSADAANPVDSTLVAYGTATDTQFELSLNANGLEVVIDNWGWNVGTLPLYTFSDGQQYHLSIVRDAVAGDVSLFINGNFFASASTPTNAALASVGSGTVGNDISASSNGSFVGTMYDMRLFDYARTDAMIAADLANQFGLNEPGLIGYWTFDALTTSGRVGNEYGAEYLHQAQSTHPGAIAGGASLTDARVDENSAVGTVVGRLQGIDPEREGLLASLAASTPNLVYSETAGIILVTADTTENWFDAYAIAQTMTLNGVSGRLAMPDSAEENALFDRAMQDQSLYFVWLSANDDNPADEWNIITPGAADVQFADMTGASVNGAYTNWHPNEPSVLHPFGSSEDYLEIFNQTSLWNDRGPWRIGGNHFFAEYDMTEVLDGSGTGTSIDRGLDYVLVSQSFAGTFGIDPNTGDIFVANNASLDYETNPLHTLTVEVVDNVGNVFQKDIDIHLNDIDDASLHSFAGVSVNEDSSISFGTGLTAPVTISDEDSPESLTLTLTATDGLLSLSGNTGLTLQSPGGTINASQITVSGTVQDLNNALSGMTFAPTANFNGNTTIAMESVRQSDYGTAGALVTSSSIPVTVIPVADTPVANNDFISVSEGGTSALLQSGDSSLLSNDTDADTGDVLTVLNNTPPSNGSVTVTQGGSFTYTHDGSETTVDSFTYQLSDGTGGPTSTGTVNINITPVNDAPQGNSDSLTVAEGGTQTSLNGGFTTILHNDTDAETPANLGVFSVATFPVNGTVVVNGDGTFSYTHDGSETVSDSFSYVIVDPGGATSAPITVGITINPVNDAPVLGNDVLSVTEGGSATVLSGGGISLLDNDTDAESDTLSIVSFTPGSNHLSVGVNSDGSFQYIHDGSETASDSFTYTVTDGNGGTATATVQVTIVPVNDAPQGNNDSLTVAEGGTQTSLNGGFTTLLHNDTDAETPANLGVFSVASFPVNGTVVVNGDGTFSYTHDGSETVSDSFSYVIVDPSGATSVPATVSITIIPVNDAPLAVLDTATVTEAGSININALANDTDAEFDALSVQLVTLPSNGFVSLNPDSSLLYTHDGSETASDSFQYKVLDGNGGESIGTINITVTPVNDAPILVDDALTVTEGGSATALAGGAVSLLSNDSDAESDPISIVSSTSGSNHSSLDVFANGSFAYTHDGSETTSDSFTYTASDGNGGIVTATVQVTIIPANDPPQANNDSITVAEGGTQTSLDSGFATLLHNDTDAENPANLGVFSVASFPVNGTVVVNGDGTFSYTHDGSETVSDSFSYVIIDPDGGTSAPATVSITITPVNDAPILVDDAFTVTEGGSATALPGGSISLLDNDSDAESDPISIVSSTPGSNHSSLSVDADGSFIYVHDGSETTQDSFTYSVPDGNGGTVTATVQVNVIPVNDIPLAGSDSISVAEGGTQSTLDSGFSTLLHNDSDIESGSNLSATLLSAPANGSLVLNANGTFSYVHNGSETTSDSFTYVVTDPDGGISVPASVNIAISPINDSPVAISDTATVAESGSVQIFVLGNDADPELDPLSVQVTAPPSFGAVVVNPDNSVLYSHDGSDTTLDTFSYSVDDGNGGTDVANVSISISPVNDPPVANADFATVNEGASFVIDVLSNDFDPDSSILSPMVIAQPSNGTLTLNNDNTFTYTHDGSETLSDSFSYQIVDDQNLASTALVQIDINPVNDAPLTTADQIAVNEGGTVTFDVLANDADPENGLLTLVLATNPQNGQVVVNADNTITYQHDDSESGSDQFQYTAFDPQGGSTTETVSVDINLTNDNVPSFSNTPLTFEVYENATTGSILGSVNATDSDVGDSPVYTLVDDAAGRFQISPAGELMVLNGSDIDREVSAQHSIVIRATDQGGNSSQTMAEIVVLDVNESAVVANTSAEHTYIENSSPHLLFPTISITDTDSSLLAFVEVEITNYRAQEEHLEFTASTNIDGSFDASTGILTLVGPAPVSEFIQAVQQVKYTNSSENPTSDTRPVKISVSDGVTTSVQTDTLLTVVQQNDISSGTPVITGSTDAGSLLSVDLSGITDLDGIASYEYVWLKNGIPIAGETDSTYVASVDDIGSDLTVMVQVIDVNGQVEPWTESLAVTPVNTEAAPVVTPSPEQEPEPSPEIGAALPSDPNAISISPLQLESVATVLSSSDINAESSENSTESSSSSSEPQATEDQLEENDETQQESDGDGEGVSETDAEGVVQHLAANITESLSGTNFRIADFQIALDSLESQSPQNLEREITLEAIEFEEQLASVLSLDPLTLEVAERMRLQWLAENPGMKTSLDELAETFENEQSGSTVASEAIVGVTVGVSTGLLVWLLRGGAMMASWMSISPVWKQFDPLPIVNSQANYNPDEIHDDDDQAVEELFGKES